MLVLAAGRAAGGPETYEVQFIRALARIDRHNEYFIYCPERRAVDAIAVAQDNFVFRVLRPSLRPISLSLLPIHLKRDRVDVLHATYASPPFAHRRMVFTMHGLVNFLHPEFFSRTVLWRLNALMRIGLRRSSCIFCVSNHVREQVHEYFSIPLDRLLVTNLGVGEEFGPIPAPEARAQVAEQFGINPPYFLHVGGRSPAKNLERLLRAFALYRQGARADIELVLVGGSGSSKPAADLIRKLELTDHVRDLPYLSPSMLPALYSGAEMFLFPSVFESFGLPVLEAMACGTPVLTSSTTCLPEIAGGAAVLVRPDSVDGIAQGISRVQSSPELRASLIAKGLERAKEFKWENCARLALSAYVSVATNGS